jgi:DNA invertase Pin-like site-specific DNA recombinase
MSTSRRATAARHEWQIVAEFSDKGISGAKGREQRPGLDKLLQAALLLVMKLTVSACPIPR